MPSDKIIFIAGPTASGKSEAACALARMMDGEIISCDSMQVYKEIRIVSNKPSAQMLTDVPHHLVDVISVEEEFDAARFNALAVEAVGQIRARGRTPIIAGGSGLYMQVLLDGIFEGGGKDAPLREELAAQAREYGTPFLYEKLRAQDPLAAQGIHPNDLRRIVRALEVQKTLKRPLSALRQDRAGLWGRYPVKAFALTMERERLYQRINGRVDQMFAQGAVEEIRRLRPLNLSLTAGRVIGVREIQGYLNGEYDEARARDLMKLNTRRFAKRQMTWFRKEKRLEWITIGKDDMVEKIARRLFQKIREEPK